jgi:hypothetical protein
MPASMTFGRFRPSTMHFHCKATCATFPRPGHQRGFLSTTRSVNYPWCNAVTCPACKTAVVGLHTEQTYCGWIRGAAPKPHVCGTAPKSLLHGAAPKPHLIVAFPKPHLCGAAPKLHMCGTAPKPHLCGAAPKLHVQEAAPKPLLRGAAPKPLPRRATPKLLLRKICNVLL